MPQAPQRHHTPGLTAANHVAPPPPGRKRPSAAAQGYGRRWRRLRLWVLARQPICAMPGCGKPAEHVDHVVPKAQGGSDDIENLQALCPACHSRKTVLQDGGFGNERRESALGPGQPP